jgi:peptidoglycan hydrolase CwlO-like protein
MVVAGPIAIYRSALADQYDDKMAALNSQKAQYQAQANTLQAQANTLQAALDQITAQKTAILAQIDITQKQYDTLQQQITDMQQKIADNKVTLGKIIADMYVDNSVTPLEMLAGSSNISDYVDKQQSQQTIQDNLKQTIDETNALKAKLEQSQKEVSALLDDQKNQKAQLAAKEAEQQALVDQTKNDEAQYQQLVNNAQSQIESAAAQQRAYYASLKAQNGGSFDSGVVGSFQYANWSGNMGCGSDGYPYCGAQDSYADDWALLNRECVSYAAWRIDVGYGKRVYPFNWNGTPHGMAYEWGQGWAKGAVRVSDPQPGDAVVLMPLAGFAPVGHLMVVESTSGDWVHVSQYNFWGTGEYSTMDIKKSGVIFLRFPNK